MLRVTTLYASSAGASARYYTRYLASDEGSEIEGPGTWLGRQADELDLNGDVSTKDLEAVLSGHDPNSGQRLGAALRDRVKKTAEVIRAVAGFDATFSAPKEVSIMWASTLDPSWLEAHDVAVAAALAHLERYGATTRVRSKLGRLFPDARGLTMAAFRQVTSRADDPQIHTHVVISTKVRTADGGWYALDARYLKKHQTAIGHLYQAVLRAELSHRKGVAWGPVVNGQAPMLGVPDELIEEFSKRSEQIAAELDTKITEFRDREGRDPTHWEHAAIEREAAVDTRNSKTGNAPEDLVDTWRETAVSLGWDTDRLLNSVQQAAIESRQQPTPAVSQSQVIDACATSSTWSRADILKAVADLAPTPADIDGRRWAAAIERAADDVVESCTTVDPPMPATTRASDGRSLWLAPIEPNLTTDAILAQEERILTFAVAAQDREPQPSASLVDPDLDVLQRDAARAVAGTDDLVVVVGPAGAGKTRMLRAAAIDLGLQRRRLFGVAPTAKAAKVLGDETGIPADTLAKLLHEWRRTDRPPHPNYALESGATVVLDEAGMVSTPALDQLTQLAASQRWRLVLVGDPRQLHAVGRGGMFDELCHTSRTHELAHIHRFHHHWERRASLLLRAGKPDGLDPYLRHGRVHAGTFDHHARVAAGRWIAETASGRSVALVAQTNDHVYALNEAVQAERRARGQVGSVGVRIAGTETTSVGDIVATRRNQRVLLTDRGEPVRNRDRWRVDAIHADGALTLSHLDGHGRVHIDAEYTRQHVSLGYAATAHGHQGDTVDTSIMIVTPTTTHRSLYVGATRGRHDNQLYVVTDSLAPDALRATLEQVLSNDRVDLPAVAQRRHLASQERPGARRSVDDRVAAARIALNDARRRAEPHLRALHAAEQLVASVERDVLVARRRLDDLPSWKRRSRTRSSLEMLEARLVDARANADAAHERAAPYLANVDDAQHDLRTAEQDASRVRLQERLTAVGRDNPSRSVDRCIGIEL